MSIIAVKKLPFHCSLPQLVKMVAKIIKGQFEALNFANDKFGEKLCYLRLSERLDPQQVVERIQRMTKFDAFIPDYVPDLPLASSKRGRIPFKLRRSLKIAEYGRPEDVLVRGHNEILAEMQYKYTGLYNLSKKTTHKLLENIAQILFERLKQIMDTNAESLISGFMLSKHYRKLHPHFGDFQLILSTLHELQDAAGASRAEMSESDLIAVSGQLHGDNIPFDKIQSACGKYSDRIMAKITEHVNTLNTDTAAGDTEEEIARKKVRQELKKISPYLPMIIKQVVSNQFIPEKTPHSKVRIYGEPSLPTKEQTSPFLKRFRAVKIMRSDRMFNLLRFSVPVQQKQALMAMDGTVIGGSKLTIRRSEVKLYKPTDALIEQMKAVFGVAHEPGDQSCLADEDSAEDDAE